VPSLIRFLTIIGIIIGLFYGTMFVLGTFFEPEPRELTKSIRNIELQ
jgi:hypothetical protein